MTDTKSISDMSILRAKVETHHDLSKRLQEARHTSAAVKVQQVCERLEKKLRKPDPPR